METFHQWVDSQLKRNATHVAMAVSKQYLFNLCWSHVKLNLSQRSVNFTSQNMCLSLSFVVRGTENCCCLCHQTKVFVLITCSLGQEVQQHCLKGAEACSMMTALSQSASTSQSNEPSCFSTVMMVQFARVLLIHFCATSLTNWLSSWQTMPLSASITVLQRLSESGRG